MTRFAVLAVSAAVLLAACGQGGSSKKITRMIDSCAVLEKIGAAELIGVTFDPPKRLRDQDSGEGLGKMSSCGLTSTAPEQKSTDMAALRAQLQNTWYVTLMVWTWPDVDSAKAYMDSMRQNNPGGGKSEDVQGLGDDAVWGGTMQARRGNVTISMDVRGPTEDSGKKSEKALETELAKRSLEAIKK